MNIDDLKLMDTKRAADFYSRSPDGQWDKEATTFLRLAQATIALAQAYADHESDDEITRDIAVGMAFDYFRAKLESL